MIIIGPIIIIVNQIKESISSPSSKTIESNGLETTIECEWCDWRGTYETPAKARQAVGRHRGHCTQNPFSAIFGHKLSSKKRQTRRTKSK